MNRFLPVAATRIAEQFDSIFYFVSIVSSVFSVLVIVAAIYFAVRFKAKDTREAQECTHSSFLEILWSVVPFIIFLVFFLWGSLVYKNMRTVPKNSLEVHVIGQKWNWTFIYKNGKKSINNLVVPIGRPVKLIMNSKDVLHSFYIPAFRVKQDVLPGTYTVLWFEASKIGNFHVFCTEYCGAGHSEMLAKLKVLTLDAWEKWLEANPYKGFSLVEIGKKNFQQRCTACHYTNNENLIGPGLKGVFGSRRNFADGSAVIADENYIRTSLLNPAQQIVAGFQNQMPPFAGLLEEQEILGLIEYIKTLK